MPRVAQFGLPGNQRVALAAASVPGTLNAAERTVEVLAYTGARVRIDSWMGSYMLELSLEPEDVDLGRFAAGAPVVDTHGVWSVNQVLGKVEKAWLAADGLHCLVRYSKRDEIKGVWQDVADGILVNYSVGPEYHEVQLIEESEDELPVYRATKWAPAELSLCAVGRDPKAQALAQTGAQPPVIVANFAGAARGAEVPIMRSFQTSNPDPAGARAPAPAATPNLSPAPAPPANGTLTATPPATAPATPAPDPAASSALAMAGAASPEVTAERQRAETITRLVGVAGLGADLAQRWIADGLSIDQVQMNVTARLAARSAASSISPHHIEVTDQTERARRDGAVLAMLHRYAPAKFQLAGDTGDAARQYVGMSLLEIARERLELHGVRTRGVSKMELAGLAFQGNSDFPQIASSVANRSLRQAYDETPRTFQPFCTRATLPDFKNKDLVQISEIPTLQRVNEHGEIRQVSLRDAKQSYRLYSSGLRLAFTRQLLVNDDIGMLTRVQQGLGASGARYESDVVWGLITGNGALGDGVALFHASHNNLLTGAGSALGITGLSSSRSLMRLQKGLDGKTVLNLAAAYLMVPTTLETSAQQLTSMEMVANQTTQVNPFARAFRGVIVEPRLDAVATIGATAWYTAADPGQVDTIEYGYLEGQEGIRSEYFWGLQNGVDGMMIVVTHDFGASVVDHRGLQRNNGQ